MRQYLIDTPHCRRLLSEQQIESMYMNAKELYRKDGARGKISILYVANSMSISIKEAGHRVRLKLEKLDYIETKGGKDYVY